MANAYVDGWKVTALNALARLRGQPDDAAVLILYADKGCQWGRRRGIAAICGRELACPRVLDAQHAGRHHP